jgi:beta-N-acetylhexosaminidase
LEDGGNGAAFEGTYFGRQMLIAATGDTEKAYQLGKVACREGAAVGVNWSFAPVVDIDMNYHNPITNVRTFGDDPKRVLEMGKAYMKAAHDEGIAAAVKHFPGDGVDERDQHLLTSVNSLTYEEWDKTFGEIYRELIDAGVKSVMVGHVAMPAGEEMFDGKPCKRVIPASLSKNMLQNLLRNKLGFNGLIITDATPMTGFTCAMDRKTAVPTAIENGCDVFLFNKDLAEDIRFMKEGYEAGILSEQRLNEAVTRILALKASLGLHEKQRAGTLVPGAEALGTLQCGEHVRWAEECADQGITLVKDTHNLLPLNPTKHKRVLLEILGGFPSNDRVMDAFDALLTKEGFQVTRYVPETPEMILGKASVESFKSAYDLVIYIGNVENASNKTVARIDWHTMFGLGNNMPWFVREVPTMFISVGNPYHLLDVPMIGTYINGYCNNSYVIKSIVEKIMGHGEFKGISPIDPFCGKWDTKL